MGVQGTSRDRSGESRCRSQVWQVDLSVYNIHAQRNYSNTTELQTINSLELFKEKKDDDSPPSYNMNSHIHQGKKFRNIQIMYVCTNYKQLQKSRFLALFQHWSVGRSIKAGRSTWGHCIPCLQYSELQRRLVNGRFHRVVATIMIRGTAAAGAGRLRKPISRQSAKISQQELGSMHTPTSTRICRVVVVPRKRKYARVGQAPAFSIFSCVMFCDDCFRWDDYVRPRPHSRYRSLAVGTVKPNFEF